MGQKSWQHVVSDKEGKTAAVPISLVQTCKALKVEPFVYLRDFLQRVNTDLASRVDTDWEIRFSRNLDDWDRSGIQRRS